MAIDQKLERVRSELEEKDSLRIRMRTLFNRAFEFRENVWNDDEKFWEQAEKHPLKYRSRFADMTNVFNKPWAARIMEEKQERQAKMTTDKLEEMGLTDDQIEKLAIANEDSGDPTDER